MEERWDFDSWAESYDEDVMSDGWIHSDYERVLRLVAERAKGVVVDVGCGTGNILRFLRCERYIGVEPRRGCGRLFARSGGALSPLTATSSKSLFRRGGARIQW